ncbi:MAG: type III-A CRISPR-associated protein Csm2 [Syntrophobacteraceae bacterium]|nr:type III-A CRISPR-associated protein Csm2 [Syntrophobacteraceae bacterium]
MPNHGRQNPRQAGQTRGGHGGAAPTSVPVATRIQYFMDSEKQKLDPVLVDAKAQEWASSFVFVRREDTPLKTTQMRRFYDDLKAIERRILLGKDVHAQQANFERDRALILMFKAKAVYAEKRRVSPRAFTQFIFDHMESIKELRDFQAFLKIFEAVVAFHRFFSEER